jgi:hypothetical protein
VPARSRRAASRCARACSQESMSRPPGRAMCRSAWPARARPMPSRFATASRLARGAPRRASFSGAGRASQHAGAAHLAAVTSSLARARRPAARRARSHRASGCLDGPCRSCRPCSSTLLLLLSLIRIHLSWASTDALQALERQLQTAGMVGAAAPSGGQPSPQARLVAPLGYEASR